MYYEHTQKLPETVLAIAGLAGLAVGFTPAGILARCLTMGAFAAAGVACTSLTVTVSLEEVKLRFGGGLFKKTLPVSRITRARAIKTTPLHGWGIHYTGNGWLYNIYGLDAVEILHANGQRTLVGSDDAENLALAINNAVAENDNIVDVDAP